MTGDERNLVESVLGELTLDEKVRLCTGHDMWSSVPIPRIGLRSMVFSDGPAGVRGPRRDERRPSVALPAGTSLGASWDPTLAETYGAVLAREARDKGVDVVLGPTVNLHRSPLGGRSFEAFSEDPFLTGRIGVGYVRGLQAHGVAASVKHYIGNDSETERIEVDVRITDRALHELYLRAFEPVVISGGAWTVMSSYNAVNGRPVTESELLTTPLKDSWGFDGVVVSDWTAVTSLESALGGQDLVMPGPDGPWGDVLVHAVREGMIAESVIDEKVRRILTLALRVGALAGVAGADTETDSTHRPPQSARLTDAELLDFAAQAAVAGFVLLKNDNGILPLHPAETARIAVIGQNAEATQAQGGGSASVEPTRLTSALEGIRRAFPTSDVRYSMGCDNRNGLTSLRMQDVMNPRTKKHGILVRFLDESGQEVWAEDRLATRLVWFSGDEHYLRGRRIELTTVYTPEVGGEVILGYAANGRSSLAVDGIIVHEAEMSSSKPDLGAAISSPAEAAVPIELVAGKPVELRLLADIQQPIPGTTALAIAVGTYPQPAQPGELIRLAAAEAEAADVAIVVVGTDAKIESEGYDRASLRLPGHQDDLVRAVVAANPRTVVVVNAGAPVELPWVGDVPAILITWFAGQEIGTALGRALNGEEEPGGRLPTTWPTSLAVTPVSDVTPVDHVLAYDESIHVGYRAWLRNAIQPAFEFGFGLGYTQWELLSATAADTVTDQAELRIEAVVVNRGARRGRQVIQVYASRADSEVERPVRWLVGFESVVVEAGETATVSIDVSTRELAHWDGDGWALEPGGFDLHVGTSVLCTPFDVPILVGNLVHGGAH